MLFKSNLENILVFEFEEGLDINFEWNLFKKVVYKCDSYENVLFRFYIFIVRSIIDFMCCIWRFIIVFV